MATSKPSGTNCPSPSFSGPAAPMRGGAAKETNDARGARTSSAPPVSRPNVKPQPGKPSKASRGTHNQAAMAAGPHLFPSRTEKLSPPAPMVLRSQRGRVGSRHLKPRPPLGHPQGRTFFELPPNLTAATPRTGKDGLPPVQIQEKRLPAACPQYATSATGRDGLPTVLHSKVN